MFLYLISLVLMWRECSGIIYVLNETEYNLMPPLFKMDEYDRCMTEPGRLYCIVDIDLFSRTNSSLMKMIQGYSAHTIKHFNHTQIHRGICVNRSCKDYQNSSHDLTTTIQECTNDSLWEEYRLEGKAVIQYCKDGSKPEFDNSDVIMVSVYIILIVLNTIGTSYDILICKDREKGNQYLLAFSLKRNWGKLVAPAGKGDDPRMERLKQFHGLRAMTMVLVIFSHTVLMIAYSYVENPLFIEMSYKEPMKHILYNGSLVTHTFFVMSAFLLAYNFQIYTEKHKITWKQFPKGVLLRWLRLTPTYALVLGTVATVMRRIGDGPLWDLVVVSESDVCRRYWWAHLFYFNNYVYDDALCLAQTWYLAADTQLFCVGLLVCVAARTPRARKVTLSIMFILSLAIPALHTYYEDLNAVVLQSPESYRNLYAHDNTFRLLYIRGHTNLSTYTLGLTGGFLAYYWQKEGKTFENLKKYRWVIWLLLPIAVGIILSGAVFYIDGVEPSVTSKVVYAALYKPAFQINVILLIWGIIFKIESVFRGIVEWRGFTWAGRVSYSAFFMHTLFQRGLAGIQLTPTYLSDYFVLIFLFATVFLSFVSAALVWLFVEAPAGGLVKAALTPREGRGTDNNKV